MSNSSAALGQSHGYRIDLLDATTHTQQSQTVASYDKSTPTGEGLLSSKILAQVTDRWRSAGKWTVVCVEAVVEDGDSLRLSRQT